MRSKYLKILIEWTLSILGFLLLLAIFAFVTDFPGFGSNRVVFSHIVVFMIIYGLVLFVIKFGASVLVTYLFTHLNDKFRLLRRALGGRDIVAEERMDYFHKKVVFLTGASSGIGEGLALALAKQGAILGLAARRKELLEAIAEKISENGGTARVFELDVTDAEAMRKAADALRKEFGKIDILIANAGIGGNNKETRSHNADAVKKVIDINLIGAVNSVAAVLPEMIEKKSGQLVAVSSLAGFRGLPKSAAYSASKAGMTAFFESIRLDVLDQGISVTIIQPGFIKTPLTSGRKSKLPFVMELDESIPYFLNAISRQKRFSAFPWQLATIVRTARFFPAFLYDRFAGRARYRE